MQRKMMFSGDSESDAGADIPPAKRARLSEAGVGRSTPVQLAAASTLLLNPENLPEFWYVHCIAV